MASKLNKGKSAGYTFGNGFFPEVKEAPETKEVPEAEEASEVNETPEVKDAPEEKETEKDTSDDKDKSKIKKEVNQRFADRTEDFKSIPVWTICPRFDNPFIQDDNQVLSLMESLECEGQAQPIRIVPIDKYLAYKGVSEDDRAYLKHFSEDYGCKYFASVGNTRLKIFMHKLTNMPFSTRTEVEDMYKMLHAQNPYLKTDNSNNPFVKIKSIISDISPEIEYQSSGNSNLTSRSIGAFERVYNAYKAIGHEEVVSEDIKDYLLMKYHLDVDIQHVRNNMRIINTYGDKRFIDAIFDGRLTPTAAITLIPAYNKIKDNSGERDDLLKNIYSQDITVEKAKEIVSKVRGSKIAPKKNKTKKNVDSKPDKVSRADVIDWLHRIIENDATPKQMLDYFTNL